MTTKKPKKTQPASSTAWGVVLASGRSSEFGADIETVFLTVGSKPLLTYSLSAFERCADVEGLVLVTSKDRLESLRALVHMFGCNKVKSIIAGPPSRENAVQAGLAVAIEHNAGFVVVHDGTRPGVTPELISETIRVARKNGAATVARPVGEPVCEAAKGTKITGTLDDSVLWQTLSPQTFKIEILQKALTNAAKKKIHLADEAAAVAAIKQDVHLVPVKRPLVRVTSPLDLNLAEFLLRH